MTPDGIQSEDWDRVHDLALAIVNGRENEAEALTEELFKYLDELERKYGRLPSIVATRADYLDDPAAAEALLEEAYHLAQQRHDQRNMMYVASSLVSLQVEEFRDPAKAQHWLSALELALALGHDAPESKEYESLAAAVERLRIGGSG